MDNNILNRIEKIGGIIITLSGILGIVIGLDTNDYKIGLSSVLFMTTGVMLICDARLRDLEERIKKLEK